MAARRENPIEAPKKPTTFWEYVVAALELVFGLMTFFAVAALVLWVLKAAKLY